MFSLVVTPLSFFFFFHFCLVLTVSFFCIVPITYAKGHQLLDECNKGAQLRICRVREAMEEISKNNKEVALETARERINKAKNEVTKA